LNKESACPNSDLLEENALEEIAAKSVKIMSHRAAKLK